MTDLTDEERTSLVWLAIAMFTGAFWGVVGWAAWRLLT